MWPRLTDVYDGRDCNLDNKCKRHGRQVMTSDSLSFSLNLILTQILTSCLPLYASLIILSIPLLFQCRNAHYNALNKCLFRLLSYLEWQGTPYLTKQLSFMLGCPSVTMHRHLFWPFLSIGPESDIQNTLGGYFTLSQLAVLQVFDNRLYIPDFTSQDKQSPFFPEFLGWCNLETLYLPRAMMSH